MDIAPNLLMQLTQKAARLISVVRHREKMTKFSTTWTSLQIMLEEFYTKRGLGNEFEADSSYLGEAYQRVEKLWHSAFNQASCVRFVLLSEAPMWGSKESYFYNPTAGATSFFWYSDAKPLVGEMTATNTMKSEVRPRKVQMIERLTAAGFVVLDLFPFSFRPGKTAVNYRQLSGTLGYRQLFGKTVAVHLSPKLELLKKKLAARSRFVFRYARVRDDLLSEVLPILVDRRLIAPAETIQSVHKGRNLDRERLAKLFFECACSA
jgi:hypothetical protein